MRSPLLQALIDKHHYPVLTEETHDAFLAEHEQVVLFFTENPQHFPESNDVAVVLPELAAQFADLTPALIDAAAERSLYKRYAFKTWPALVFLRRGEYLGVITGMQDWAVFQQEFARLLAAAPTQPPHLVIPMRAEGLS